MWAGVLLLAAASLADRQPDERLEAILARVSEEAEVFFRTAPKLLAEETLRQRAQRPRGRFRPRIGNADSRKPQYRTRVVVSEYGYSFFRDSPGALHEFREVVSVDGRTVRSREEARRTLVKGMVSEDDYVKRKLLEDFEKHGLSGAVTDFGQLLLLFARRSLRNYEFEAAGEESVGSVAAQVVRFRQRGGNPSLLIFEKREAVRQPLEGDLWVRKTDYVPLRIVLRSSRQRDGQSIRDEATVEYGMGAQGALAPVSVLHRQFVDSEMLVENDFRYSGFRRFAVETDIVFPDEPALQEKR